jgi:hypothetical protein
VRPRTNRHRPSREKAILPYYAHNNKHDDKTLLLSLIVLLYCVAGGEFIPTTTRVISVYLHRETSAFPAVPAAAQPIYIVLLYISSKVVAGIPVPSCPNDRRRWPRSARRPVMFFSPAHTHVTHHTSSSSSQSFNIAFSCSFTVVASVAPLVVTVKFTRLSTGIYI